MKQHFQGRQSFAIGSSHSLHFLQTNKVLSQNIVFTKVGSIGPVEDDHKTGKIGKGHNDPEALVDHQDLGVLSQLALVKSHLC